MQMSGRQQQNNNKKTFYIKHLITVSQLLTYVKKTGTHIVFIILKAKKPEIEYQNSGHKRGDLEISKKGHKDRCNYIKEVSHD